MNSCRLTPRIFTFLGLILLSSCAASQLHREITATENAAGIERNPYLKVHMNDGSLYILRNWKIDAKAGFVAGKGKLYNLARKETADFSLTPVQVSFDDIALFETNDIRGYSGQNVGMVLVGVPTLVLSAICLMDPKACFGSCPTIYTDYDSVVLQAEGFSSSISKSLESRDVDLLQGIPEELEHVEILIKNEALETHFLKEVNLLVADKPNNAEMVLQTSDNDFLALKNIRAPLQCRNPGYSCLSQIAEDDRIEWYSLADSTNLATKEEMHLVFEANPDQEAALVLTSRQSLMTTYLFYQSLAYFGRSVGYWMARFERGDKRMMRLSQRFYDRLGGIEVWQKVNDRYELVEEVVEMGPIASDTHLIPLLSSSKDTIEIKLVLTKGLWRIDRINVADNLGKVPWHSIGPVEGSSVTHEGLDIVQTLHDPEEYVVTYPGDEVRLTYDLSGFGTSRELFIESTGYYLEWTREEWLADESPRHAYMMFNFPGRYLKRMAPHFKKAEPMMEELFWNSRYVKRAK